MIYQYKHNFSLFPQILVKTILKNKSFKNPFVKELSRGDSKESMNMKDEFHKAGRSNSAPESLEVMKRYVQNNISFIVTFSVIVRIKYDH